MDPQEISMHRTIQLGIRREQFCQIMAAEQQPANAIVESSRPQGSFQKALNDEPAQV